MYFLSVIISYSNIHIYTSLQKEMEVYKISITDRMQTGCSKGLGVEGNREKLLSGHRILFWGDGSV